MSENSWFARLKTGLNKSSQKIGGGIASIFTHTKLDSVTLAELEELLIMSDVGTATSQLITQRLAEGRFDKEITPEQIKAALSVEIEKILLPIAKPLSINPAHKPHVILVVGVNGTGKTTTIGKMARRLKQHGHSLLLAAADTFRAAAVEQLKIWGERNQCKVISAEQNSDPASVAYQALEQAQKDAADILLIDSAGRLQNKSNLMAELQKIIKVIRKLDASAPHSVLLVLDATTGQNAINQVEVFRELVEVTGLVVTKLDGTAKGGVVVGLAHRFGLPIHAVGVGESIEDFREFSAKEFAENLTGVG